MPKQIKAHTIQGAILGGFIGLVSSLIYIFINVLYFLFRLNKSTIFYDLEFIAALVSYSLIGVSVSMLIGIGIGVIFGFLFGLTAIKMSKMARILIVLVVPNFLGYSFLAMFGRYLGANHLLAGNSFFEGSFIFIFFLSALWFALNFYRRPAIIPQFIWRLFDRFGLEVELQPKKKKPRECWGLFLNLCALYGF
jgi:hypothetical protein